MYTQDVFRGDVEDLESLELSISEIELKILAEKNGFFSGEEFFIRVTIGKALNWALSKQMNLTMH